MYKTVDEYMSMPYARVLTPDSEGYYVAEILEFEGCVAEGRSPAQALKMLDLEARDWLEVRIEEGAFIPEPFANSEMSGRFALRMPQSLHTKAAILAEREGVSLNTFIVSTLAMGVGALDLLDKWLSRGDANRPIINQYFLVGGIGEAKGTTEFLPPPVQGLALQELKGTVG